MNNNVAIAIEIEKAFLKCKIGLDKKSYKIRELENDINNKISYLMTIFEPLSFAELSYMVNTLKQKIGINENDIYITPNNSNQNELFMVIMVNKK